jgi:hypothetical protein
VSFNLLVYSADPSNATSLYRAMGPLGDLRRRMDINLVMMPAARWDTISMVDAVFMQRPSSDAMWSVAQMAKRLGKPLWIDWDDDPFLVPTDNPAADHYDQGTLRTVAKLIAVADIVTVSTRKLASVVRDLNPGMITIPNALDTASFGAIASEFSANPLVMWRGSPTHERDLRTHEAAIREAIAGDERWVWAFGSYNPYFITDDAATEKRVRRFKPMDPVVYFQFLRNTRPALMIVPLADHRFNRCKSNIAWLEATYAGAACLAPAWEEWDHPGVIRYDGQSQFREKLHACLEGTIDLEAEWTKSAACVREKFTLDLTNRQRGHVVLALKDIAKNEEWRESAINQKWLPREVPDAAG